MSKTRATNALSASTTAADRRSIILAEALELLAEEGYAGASLRKLAKRLGIAQPSLYHYFRTKEDLVEQVLATYGGRMMFSLRPEDIPERLDDIPRFIADTTLRLFEETDHASFTRVAIYVSRIEPRFEVLMRRVFVDQADWGIHQIMRPFVEAGEITEDEALDLVRMMINALGLRLIEDHVMFPDQPQRPDLERYTEFVVDAGRTMIRSLRRRRRERSE